MFERVALIGIGLIGSSLARVIRRDGLAGHVVGCARSEATRTAAIELGIADSVTDDPAIAAADADLVMICTPVGAYGAVAARIGPVLKPGCIVSDVGSVKRVAIEALGPHLPDGVHLVSSPGRQRIQGVTKRAARRR